MELGWAKLAAFTGVTILLTLGAIEAAFRIAPPSADWLGHAPGDPGSEACIASDITRGWAPRPGTCGVDDARHILPDPPLPDLPGAQTVLVVGDSIGTRDGWVRETEARVNARLKTPARFVNASVSGYNACQERVVILEDTPALDPDLILIQTCANDLNGSPVLAPSPRPGWVRSYQGDDYREIPALALRSRALTWGLLRHMASQAGDTQAGDQRAAAAWACYKDLARFAKEAGVPIVAVHIPELNGTDGPLGARSLAAEGRVEDAVSAAGLPALKLRAAMEAAAPLESLRDGPGDILHPGPKAYPIIGEALADALITGGYLGETRD